MKEFPLTQVATSARSQVIAGRPHRLAFDPAGTAAPAFEWTMDAVRPAIRLGDSRGVPWLPKADLLSSDAFAPEFVAEVENDLRVRLRMGDDENGMRPDAGTSFFAVYRVGNGTRGNVGAGAIVHVTAGALGADAQWIEAVTNPLPAKCGTDPETLEQVRQYAPTAFRTQRRAVAPDDYAARAQEHADVQRAAATPRWTGSWYTVFLTVDRLGGRAVDDAFEAELRRFIEPYRMAGHDLEIDGPRYVPLELELFVCVDASYFQSDVVAALRDVFSSRTRAGGGTGFFHPDRFTFGQPVHLSQVYAAAQQVPGVRHVEVRTFQRQGTPSTAAIESGTIDIRRLEIARLDNDPNFPDRGLLRFTTAGGR